MTDLRAGRSGQAGPLIQHVADLRTGTENRIQRSTEFIPFALPTIDDNEIAEVVSSLRSGWVTTGPKVKEFEEAVADYVGASHAIAVNSCTAGLHLALHGLGVGPGDEVIVPTLTFCSTANVVDHLGARPVLVDIGPHFNVEPGAIEAAITERTRAIMPVHFAGQAVELDEIYAVAHRHDLAVVEDAAHAIGSRYRNLPIGADAAAQDFPGLRRAVVYSFYATKNLTTGEGGMVVTADPDLADRVRVLSLHGMSRDAWKRYSSAGSWYYEVVAPGFKSNMTDIQAALGLRQLEKLDGFIARRRRQADIYDRALSGYEVLGLPHRLPDRLHAFHLYVIRLDLDRLDMDRAQFIDALREYNVGTSVHFIPVHMHPYYRDAYGYRPEDLPVAQRTFDQIVSLPVYPRLPEENLHYIAGAIGEIISSHSTDHLNESLKGQQ